MLPREPLLAAVLMGVWRHGPQHTLAQSERKPLDQVFDAPQRMLAASGIVCKMRHLASWVTLRYGVRGSMSVSRCLDFAQYSLRLENQITD